jgi:hypothetical protein
MTIVGGRPLLEQGGPIAVTVRQPQRIAIDPAVLKPVIGSAA